MTAMQKGLYVVMGVAGAGKSLIGAAFARAIGVEFVEGDSYHPSGNVTKMSSGIALTDADRQGWLHALAARLRQARDDGTGLVLTCSALKRSYRDLLRAESGVPGLQFVFLRGDRDLIAKRLAGRRGHFWPASLLDTQFDALEEPSSDEEAWVCDVAESPERIVAELVTLATRTRA